MSTPELSILVFGQLVEITGAGNISLPMVSDSNALQELLNERFPPLSTVSYVIAVDKKLVIGNTVLTPQSSIALLPPFSGG